MSDATLYRDGDGQIRILRKILTRLNEISGGGGGGGGSWGSITGTLSNQTDLQSALNAKQGTISFGTGVQTALGVAIGSAGAPVLFNGALGTPSSGTLTNATGLPIASGVSGLGTGVATALAVNIGSAGAPVLFNGAGGTPSSITLTNATGLPVGGVSGLGTGVATALAVNVGSAGAFVTFNGALGTPSSGTLTNATGLPIASGVSGLGTGVATFLATPSGANLASALTTALPASKGGTGLTALGTGVATALGVAVGSAGAFVTFNGALGTPSSGTLTNATGLPISTGVSGLGTGVATFLATPSGANLASALTSALPVTKGGTALTAIGSALQYLRVNAGATALEYATLAAGGDVVGPASATDNAVVRFDLTTGKLIQNSVVTIADTTGDIATPGGLSVGTSSGAAGGVEFVQGTAPTAGTTSVKLYGAAAITAYIMALPGAAATGFLLGTNSAGTVTLSFESSTGSGNVVRATSPTLVTPVLGTPSSGTLTSCTGLPVSTGISGLGTGVATALAVNVGSAGAFVTFNGALGTPSSGTLTNATGLPISTGVSGLGTGVATFLATPSSANLITAITDETGSGALVFGTSPTLTTPIITTPQISLTTAHASNNTYSGLSLLGQNNSGGVTQWDAVYLNSSSQWVKADANGSGTYPARGMAVTTQTTGQATTVLVRGTVRFDTWNWTPGGAIYLDGATAGGYTQTPPASSGDKIQQVGFAITADIAFFDFNSTFLTVT